MAVCGIAKCMVVSESVDLGLGSCLVSVIAQVVRTGLGLFIAMCSNPCREP